MNDVELDRMLDAWKAPGIPLSLRESLRSRFPTRQGAGFRRVRPRWLLAFAATAGALAIGGSLVQDGSIQSDAGPWGGGLHMRRTRIVHPYLAKFAWGAKPAGVTGRRWGSGKLGGSVYIFDGAARVHYGYTWTAEPFGGGQYHFRALPLDPSVLKENAPVAPRPVFEKIVGPGSTFDVDLYISGNQRVWDRYELSAAPLPLPELEGLNVITLTKPQLFVNGAFALDAGPVVKVASECVYVALSGRGRYFLAINPHGDPRFQLAGTARGNAIEFQAGGETFRIACTAPVTRRGGSLGVYVYAHPDAGIASSEFAAGGPPRELGSPGL